MELVPVEVVAKAVLSMQIFRQHFPQSLCTILCLQMILAQRIVMTEKTGLLVWSWYPKAWCIGLCTATILAHLGICLVLLPSTFFPLFIYHLLSDSLVYKRLTSPSPVIPWRRLMPKLKYWELTSKFKSLGYQQLKVSTAEHGPPAARMDTPATS